MHRPTMFLRHPTTFLRDVITWTAKVEKVPSAEFREGREIGLAPGGKGSWSSTGREGPLG